MTNYERDILQALESIARSLQKIERKLEKQESKPTEFISFSQEIKQGE